MNTTVQMASTDELIAELARRFALVAFVGSRDQATAVHLVSLDGVSVADMACAVLALNRIVRELESRATPGAGPLGPETWA